MGKKINLTKILEKNQIWFTTIASVTLSLMAIILSINSNNLSKQQIAIDYANNHPEFQIHKALRSSQENGIIDDLELIITNKNNGTARNLVVSSRMFLDISLIQRSYSNEDTIPRKKTELKRFFLLDQFNSILNSNDNKYIIKSPTNIKHVTFVNDSVYIATQEQRVQLYSYMLNNELLKSNMVAILKREIIIELSYINFMNKDVKEYFRIHLKPIKDEMVNTFGNNMNIEFLGSDKNAEKIFFSNDKHNYVSFVMINNFKEFFEKINEKQKYDYSKIGNIRYSDMLNKMFMKVDQDYTKTKTEKNSIEQIRKDKFIQLLREMKIE